MTKQKGESKPSPGFAWARSLSNGMVVGALLVIASSALMAQPGRRRGWYQLIRVLPGESVPNWLFTGQSYEGIPDEGGRLVKVYEPETGFSHLVPAELLREVDAPAT